MLHNHPAFRRAARARAAFTLMEILVVVSIILVLAAIALPVYSTVLSRANKAAATNNMRQITATLISYAGQNDGEFPGESLIGGNSWAMASAVGGAQGDEAAKVWFNALPRLVGQKGVGDYAADATSKARYYTKANLLYLPGANYPLGDLRLAKPFFAFAVNTKLQRKSKGQGKARLSQITNPARTVAFLEEGLPPEGPPLGQKAMSVQSDYAGEPKAAGRSFPERYDGQGVITFLDGHAENHAAKDFLNARGLLTAPPECTAAGAPPEKTSIIWTRNPEEDPNH